MPIKLQLSRNVFGHVKYTQGLKGTITLPRMCPPW